MSFFDNAVSILYPKRCPICDRAIPVERWTCSRCSMIRPISGDTCIKCGKPMGRRDGLHCLDCSSKIHYFDRGFAVFEYPVIKESLYRFKYGGRAEYAAFYAYAAYKSFGKVIEGIGADTIVPVPIHRKRARKRGYNQAEELALCLSRLTDIPVDSNLIVRTRATKPLKLLGEEERKNNLKRAFTISRNDVKLKSIIIVDDIYTTGATIDTMSLELRRAGIEKIYFLTVAAGQGI